MYSLCDEDLVSILCNYLRCDLGSVEADRVREYVKGLAGGL